MAVQIQLRNDTAANWTSANPTLAAGEIGVNTDNLSVKVGDGVTAWNDLAYFGVGSAYVDAAIATRAESANANLTGTTNVEELIVSGDLTVSGTTTTVNAQDLVVSDPLIYIGEGNAGNVVDLGLVASFDDGTYQHAGLVRDSSSNTWKLFRGVTDEPTTTVNFSQATLDNLELGNISAKSPSFDISVTSSFTPSNGAYISVQDWGSNQVRIQQWSYSSLIPYAANETFFFTNSTFGGVNVDNISYTVVSSNDYGMYNEVVAIPTSQADYSQSTTWVTAVGGSSFSTGTITFNQLVANQVSAQEVSYLDGVTSGIQSQLDSKAPLAQAIETKTSAYTLQASDSGKVLLLNGTFTVSVPSGVFGAGERVDFINTGQGAITFSGTGNLSLFTKGAAQQLANQYGAGTVLFADDFSAYLIGDIS